MTTSTLTPFDLSDAVQVGALTFRKQVLPLGSITYKGEKIEFDKAFLTDLATSFKAAAYDQVPVQFADGNNQHNEDPRNFGGEVVGLELADDGLDAIIKFNADGAAAVAKNPRLGVSARIVQGIAKADGRTFDKAIRHVLMTMNPRVTGMRPWQAVDLSDGDDTEVVDLTTATYEEDGNMGKKATPAVVEGKITTADGKTLVLADLSDADFTALLADLAVDVEDKVETDVAPETNAATPEEGEVFEKDGKQYVVLGGKTMLLTLEEPVATEPVKVVGSADPATDLSDVIDVEARKDLRSMRESVAKERFVGEKDRLIAAGVPPFMIDLAEALLNTPDEVVIDLAEGQTGDPVNATATVRKMLKGMAGIVDLHPEIGHRVDLSEEDKVDPDDALLAAWNDQYGN